MVERALVVPGDVVLVHRRDRHEAVAGLGVELGTVFQLTPPTTGDTFTLRPLYTFACPGGVCADGARFLWDGRSTPLGSSIGGTRIEAVYELAPDETLVLYTDGLIERRSTGIDVMLDALLDAAARIGGAHFGSGQHTSRSVHNRALDVPRADLRLAESQSCRETKQTNRTPNSHTKPPAQRDASLY